MQLKHGTLWRAPLLTSREDDTLKRSHTAQKTKLEQGPEGGPRAKERRTSIMLKDRAEEGKEKKGKNKWKKRKYKGTRGKRKHGWKKGRKRRKKKEIYK
jgi:hypothetical protein